MAQQNRQVGLDCGRFFAISAVILGHAYLSVPWVLPVDIGLRFAVPFFFMLSGFFLRAPDGRLMQALLSLTTRIMAPFVLWLAIYLVWFEPPSASFSDPIYLAKLVVQGGPAHHLWFLPSLAVSSALLLALLKFGCAPRSIIAVAIMLYGFGLAFGAYHDVLFGGSDFFWNMRNGPFFGFPFMVAGWVIARMPTKPHLGLSLMIFALGAAGQAAETMSLAAFGHGDGHDQLLATSAFGIGFFLLVYNMPDVPLTRALGTAGRCGLGIYCMHLLVLEVLHKTLLPFGIGWDTPAGAVAAAAFTLTLSLCLCLLAKQVPWLRPLITGSRVHEAREAAETPAARVTP